MPIRGHSGVQGGAEMGCYASVLPGGVPIEAASAANLEREYGFPIRAQRGLSAAEMVEAAGRGEVDLLWSVGGNFLDTMPDPHQVEAALERVPLRVHQDIVVSSQMLAEPGEAVLLLPATTRYEQPGGGTETTTERRVAFSPEIPGHRIGEARAEWQVLLELARRVDPARALERCDFSSAQAVREEIARVVPFYDGIQHLSRTGDAIQWGGERLCDGWVFPTSDGKAHFSAVRPRELELPPGRFLLSTRRGKQFNTMVWKKSDPLTGADRDALFMADSDARSLGLGDRDPVWVRSARGELRARVKVAPMRPGNVQMFFPEANPLIEPGRRDPVALIPDYNATVEVVPVRQSAAGEAQGFDRERQPPPASGIVLAGGRSSRFGRDKLLEALDGRPLLDHAVRLLAGLCREVIVVGPRSGLDVPLPDDLTVPLRVVADRRPFAGPLHGVAIGAETARERVVVIVGGDMPRVEPAVLRSMLARLAASDAGHGPGQALGVQLEGEGRPQELPLVLDREAAWSAASDLEAAGQTSLRALTQALDIAVVPEREWRALDPEARTLLDVDAPDDLARVR
jgi:molybdopterin-guanine dinucleotide biosynthesis protein A